MSAPKKAPAKRKPLRVVAADEKAPDRPKTVTEAASNGSPRELLAAMRDRVARDVESPNTPARDLAALTRRLLEITREIELIDSKEADDELDVGDERFDASAI